MKVELSCKEANVVELTVAVPQPEVEQAVERAYRKIRKDFSLPGFRKGRVPRNILEKRYGVEIFYEEAANILLQDSYPRAIEEKELEPVSQPEIEVEQIDIQQPFVYKATVTVKPEVKLGQYKDLGIGKDQVEVSAEDIQSELEKLRNQRGQLVSVPAGTAAQLQDQVIIDFTGRLVGGEEFNGGNSTNFPLTLGSGSFVPGFEDQLVGVKVGDKVTVKLTMPEDYNSEKLAGKEVEFDVEVKEIKRRQLPELNDDFAKEVGDYETLAELKDFIREKLEDRAREKANRDHREKVVEAVRDNAEVDIPAVMIDNEVEAMVRQMENRFAQRGFKLEELLTYSGKKVDDLRQEMRPEAEKNVKTELVLDTLVRVENIKVEGEELDKEIAQLAQAYGQEAAKLKQALASSGQLAGIEQVLLHRKAIDFLVEANAPKE